MPSTMVKSCSADGVAGGISDEFSRIDAWPGVTGGLRGVGLEPVEAISHPPKWLGGVRVVRGSDDGC